MDSSQGAVILAKQKVYSDFLKLRERGINPEPEQYFELWCRDYLHNVGAAFRSEVWRGFLDSLYENRRKG
jgi:hypothetical protein